MSNPTLHIIGTIKIDTKDRQGILWCGLQSMAPIAHVLRWQFNIAGRNAAWARDEILKRWPDAEITLGDDVPIYFRQKEQMSNLGKDSYVFLWQEDHWFLCPHPGLFLHLLEEYEASGAEALNVTHLTAMWERKHLLPATHDTHLYKVHLVNSETQAKLWAQYPKAYLVGIPNIFSWRLAGAILEFKRRYMSMVSVPGFELSERPDEGPAFLRSRGFKEMVPKFHVFREVSIGLQAQPAHSAVCNIDIASRWLTLRDGKGMLGECPDHLGWRHA